MQDSETAVVIGHWMDRLLKEKHGIVIIVICSLSVINCLDVHFLFWIILANATRVALRFLRCLRTRKKCRPRMIYFLCWDESWVEEQRGIKTWLIYYQGNDSVCSIKDSRTNSWIWISITNGKLPLWASIMMFFLA